MSAYAHRMEVADRTSIEEVLAILSAVNLPHDGVRECIDGFLLARLESGVSVGCAGLERYGDLGLLRSVAVLPEYQGHGIGAVLIRHLLSQAPSTGIAEVVLLTTDKADYFRKRFGFETAERSGYDTRLRDSREWSLPRCSSAVLMSLRLNS